MRTPVGVADLEEAWEQLLALTTQSSRLTAGLDGMEEARRALRRICDEHADIGSKLAGSLGDEYILRSADGAAIAGSFGGLDEARKAMLGISEEIASRNADMAAILESFGGLDEARKAMLGISGEIASRNADMAAIVESFGGLDEARKAMLGISGEIAGERAHWQQTFDNLTRSLNTSCGGMISDTSFLGMADCSKTLQDAVNKNHALSSRIDDSIAGLTNPPDFHNPIHDTTDKLDQMITMQVDLARFQQSLNETTIAFLSDFRNVAQKTSRQTRIFMGLGFLTLIAAIVGTWLNFVTNNDMTTANREMLESLADRIATIQSNMALQSANEREAMLTEQRRLIEQLVNTTQALIEQQAIEQRATIKQLKDVLERQPGEVRPGLR